MRKSYQIHFVMVMIIMFMGGSSLFPLSPGDISISAQSCQSSPSANFLFLPYDTDAGGDWMERLTVAFDHHYPDYTCSSASKAAKCSDPNIGKQIVIWEGEIARPVNINGTEYCYLPGSSPILSSSACGRISGYQSVTGESGAIFYDGHDGHDWALPLNTAIRAAAPGVITSFSSDTPLGITMKIDHLNGYSTQYSHLSSRQSGLNIGSCVETGQIIGTQGQTGNSTGDHLHFMVFHGNNVTDPFGWCYYCVNPPPDPLISYNGEASQNLWYGTNPRSVVLNSDGSQTVRQPRRPNIGFIWNAFDSSYLGGPGDLPIIIQPNPTSIVATPISTIPAPISQAILYDNPDYHGELRSFGPGRHDIGSTWNDRAHSLRIPTGWSVRLYEHGNYQGQSMCFANNTPSLPGPYAEGVSSLHVFTNGSCHDDSPPQNPTHTPTPQLDTCGGVILHDGGGNQITFRSNVNNLAEYGWNDRPRYLEVLGPYRAIAYDGYNLEGWSHGPFTGGYNSIGTNVTSVRVEKTGSCPPTGPDTPSECQVQTPGVFLVDGSGNQLRLTASNTNLAAVGWNDRARHIRVDGPYRATAYDSENLSGWSHGPFTHGAYVPIGTNVSSVRVEIAIDCFNLPTPVPTATPIPTATRNPPQIGNGTGLLGIYFAGTGFEDFAFSRIDQNINFDWPLEPDPALLADGFSVRWRGQIQSQFSEPYTFRVTLDDGARLKINGQVLIDQWHDQVASYEATISLVANQKYDLELDYYENTGGAVIRLEWWSYSQIQQVIPSSQLYPANDSISPMVQILDFQFGDVVNDLETLSISANASDTGTGIAKVQFFAYYDPAASRQPANERAVLALPPPPPPPPSLNQFYLQDNSVRGLGWYLIDSDTRAADGWSVSWDISDVPDQPIDLYAYAFDFNGNLSSDHIAGIQLDRTPPTGRMTSPAIDTTIYGDSVVLNVDAFDSETGIQEVSFMAWSPAPFSNEQWIHLATDSQSPWTYTWDISSLPDTTVHVSAFITDWAGNNYFPWGDSEWTRFVRSTQAPNANLLANPGFEELLVSPHSAEWKLNIAGKLRHKCNLKAHSGSCFAQLKATAQGVTKLSQTVDLTIQENQRLNFGAQIRGQQLAASGLIMLKVYGGGAVVGKHKVVIAPGTYEYSQFAGVFNVPINADRAKFTIHIKRGEGKVRVDDTWLYPEAVLHSDKSAPQPLTPP